MSSVSDFPISFSYSIPFSYSFRKLKPAVGLFSANLSYENENGNGYDKHLRSQTDLWFSNHTKTFVAFIDVKMSD